MKLCTASALAYLAADTPQTIRSVWAAITALGHSQSQYDVDGYPGATLHSFKDGSFIVLGMDVPLPDGGRFDCVQALVSISDTSLMLSEAMHAARVELNNLALKLTRERSAPATVNPTRHHCGEPSCATCNINFGRLQ